MNVGRERKADGNAANHSGGGPEVGYQILRPLSVVAGWGRIFETNDGARGNMWRVRVNFVF